MNKVGLISLATYLPANTIEKKLVEPLCVFLDEKTQFPKPYISMIRETGALPGTIETNYDGWESQPWYDAWVKSIPAKKQSDPFQGTKERRRVPLDPESVSQSIVPHPMLPSDAEVLAASIAILRSGLDLNDIDLVLAHSQVPDRALPQNVSLVQYKMRIKNAGAYSIDTCCSSFVTMIEVATALVQAGIKKNVLIVSSFLDSHVTDKSTHFSVDTGDGAAAGIVSATDCGYLGSHSTSHGERHDGIIYEERKPLLYKEFHTKPNSSQLVTTFLNKEACKDIAVNSEVDMKQVVEGALRKSNLTIEDIDFFVTHQPVAWAGNAWRSAIGMPKEKFYESFEKYGNIATAASATNLTEAIEKDLIKANDKIIVASSGAGENHIAIAHEISETLVNNVKRFI